MSGGATCHDSHILLVFKFYNQADCASSVFKVNAVSELASKSQSFQPHYVSALGNEPKPFCQHKDVEIAALDSPNIDAIQWNTIKSIYEIEVRKVSRSIKKIESVGDLLNDIFDC